MERDTEHYKWKSEVFMNKNKVQEFSFDHLITIAKLFMLVILLLCSVDDT